MSLSLPTLRPGPTGAALLTACLCAACGGPNKAPSAPAIDIEPAMPHTLDDLRLVITEPAVDPDGDTLLYHTRWFQDGEIRDRVRGDIVPAHRTQAGEYWIAELWATDGLLDSPVAEATVFVFNTAPEAVVRIQPDRPDTRDDLEARARASDLDGHAVEFEFVWSVDGAATEHASASVPASATAKHELWMVAALPYDGDSWGIEVIAEITVANTAPGAPVVEISPGRPRPGRDDLLCVVDQPGDDPDDDEQSYRVAWQVDGADYEDAMDGEIPGDTIPTEVTARGQDWECRVWADDGEAEGRPGQDAIHIQ